ncbi:hypothetical protein DY000_02021538 [Brassica cretica]|uniref:Uncharacterized protein n=1 Tax=Brassica cretica TaxID=69181 RepID=A0ABQ7EJJ0_BRACR|nr:hypothetical protein DY000_02021538 [Brassica cretica]
MDEVNSDELADFLTEGTLEMKNLMTSSLSPCKAALLVLPPYNWVPSSNKNDVSIDHAKLVYKMFHGVRVDIGSPQSAGKFQFIHLGTIAAPGQPIDADEAKLALDTVSAAIQQLSTAMQTLTSVVGQITSMLYPRGEEEGDDSQQQDDQEN